MISYERILPHYFQILHGEIIPNYIKCKYISTPFNEKDSTEQLWKIHNDTLTSPFSMQEEIVYPSFLDLKIEILHRIYKKCILCEHRCEINRTTQKGFCGVSKPHISTMFHHMGEEPMLVPSLTIFFSGCNFQCIYCQNHDISQNPERGFELDNKSFSIQIENTVTNNTKNINWVGGDPTPNLFLIMQVLKDLNKPIPQIWNSNMYCSVETMQLLNGIIDLYLTDFKYGNNNCAKTLSSITKYDDTIKRNHKQAESQADIIIRHLVLPGHKNCCTKPILKWIKENLKQPLINIMDQYYPCYDAIHHKTLRKVVDKEDFQDIINYAKELDLYLI